MARKFAELEAKMSPQALAESNRLAQEMLAEIAIQKLRKTLNLTQAQVADALAVNQAALSKTNGKGDLYVATLRNFIEALGGQLELVASFPDRKVVINQIDDAT